MLQIIRKYMNIDIILEQDDYSIKFYQYYSDDNWKVALKCKDTIEIYNQEGIMIDEIRTA